MIWYALRTAPQKEFNAADAVKLMGGNSIVPFEIQYRRAQGKHSQAIVKKVKSPLIPGYCFAGFHYAPWQEIRAEDTIIGVVTMDGYPARLTANDLLCLNAMHKDAFRHSRHNKAFQVGDSIRITEGPMLDRESILHKIMSDKVQVEMQPFGKVTIPVKSIERV